MFSPIIHSLLSGDINKDWRAPNILGFENPGIGYEIIGLLIHGIPLFCVLAYLDSTLVQELDSKDIKRITHGRIDSDVKKETKVVKFVVRKRKFRKFTMAVLNLHKIYGTFHAIKGVSFSLRMHVSLKRRIASLMLHFLPHVNIP